MILLLFLKKSVRNKAASVSIVAAFYGVNPKNLQRQYKDYLIDFKSWDQKKHAKDWLLFPKI
ncbi:MAG: transposase [Polaribacter sp.]